MLKPKLAISVLVLLVTTFHLYQRHRAIHSQHHQQGPRPIPLGVSPAVMDAHKRVLLSNLTISLRQTSSVEPITLALSVRNNNPFPITILAWDSPLDPLALQLGLLAITPFQSSTPLDVPEIKVARKNPPNEESLVEVGARETSPENEVVFKEMLVGKLLKDLQVDKASVTCQGTWRAVWAASKSELGEDSLQKMGADGKAVSGEFRSGKVVIRISE